MGVESQDVSRDELSRYQHQPLTFSQGESQCAALLDDRCLALRGQLAHADQRRLVGELAALREPAPGSLFVLVQMPDPPGGVSACPGIEPNGSRNAGHLRRQFQVGFVPRGPCSSA